MSTEIQDSKISKSKRVRDYISAHPRTRNKDIVIALAEFGIKAADVSNAKSQMKRKKKRRATVAAPKAAASTKRIGRPKGSTNAAKEASLSVADMKVALDYVQNVGGLGRAQEVLKVFEQIKSL